MRDHPTAVMGGVTVSKLPVIEMFGPTIQGEGAVIGVKTMFVRTYGCDYRCNWCDSAFTWDGSAKDKVRLLEPEAIADELMALAGGNFDSVTISGGNPALIGEGMKQLIDILHPLQGIQVAIETQGSRWQDWFYEVDVLTISPKPPSSGMKTDWDKLDEIMLRVGSNGKAAHSLKVVVFSREDYEYARKVHFRYPRSRCSFSRGTIMSPRKATFQAACWAGWNGCLSLVIADPQMNKARVLPQLHALIWHNKRGK
jgi:7-carboxy-7-deazaguanine synthase